MRELTDVLSWNARYSRAFLARGVTFTAMVSLRSLFISIYYYSQKYIQHFSIPRFTLSSLCAKMVRKPNFVAE